MKNLLVILSAVLFFAACQTADKKQTGVSLTAEEKRSVLQDSSKFTTIEWLDSNFIDYGQIKEGTIKEVVFRFKNTGDHNLVIVNAQGTCGCTEPETPTEPILPGKEGAIRAKFKSSGQPIGTVAKTISVEANTKPSTQSNLTFTVEITK